MLEGRWQLHGSVLPGVMVLNKDQNTETHIGVLFSFNNAGVVLVGVTKGMFEEFTSGLTAGTVTPAQTAFLLDMAYSKLAVDIIKRAALDSVESFCCTVEVPWNYDGIIAGLVRTMANQAAPGVEFTVGALWKGERFIDFVVWDEGSTVFYFSGRRV